MFTSVEIRFSQFSYSHCVFVCTFGEGCGTREEFDDIAYWWIGRLSLKGERTSKFETTKGATCMQLPMKAKGKVMLTNSLVRWSHSSGVATPPPMCHYFDILICSAVFIKSPEHTRVRYHPNDKRSNWKTDYASLIGSDHPPPFSVFSGSEAKIKRASLGSEMRK